PCVRGTGRGAAGKTSGFTAARWTGSEVPVRPLPRTHGRTANLRYAAAASLNVKELSMSQVATFGESVLIEWVQRFVRYPSQQTARFEQEPEVQGFIAECVMPQVAELKLPMRRDAMGNLLVEIGPQNSD